MILAAILHKLHALRRRIRALLLLDGALFVAIVFGVLVAGSFLLDWTFHFPFGLRLVLLIGMAASLAVAVRRAARAAFATRLSDETLALVAQRRYPDVGDDLISAIQLDAAVRRNTTDESRDLIDAALHDFADRYATSDFQGAVSARGLLRPALFAAILLIALSATSLFFPAAAGTWFRRCILLHDEAWPPATHLHVTIANIEKYRVEKDGDVTVVWVPEDSVLRVDVVAEGEVPGAVQIRKFVYPRDENPEPVTIEMPARASSNAFEYKFGRVASSFEFFVEGGDDVDEEPYFRIMVRAAPRLEALAVDYDYPAYINETGEMDRTGVREYNVIGPEGTTVVMNFKTSGDAREFNLHIQGHGHGEQVLPLEPVPGDPAAYRWTFDLERDFFYTYRMVGLNGAPSREESSFNVSSQPDLAPEINIIMPEAASVDVSSNATLPFSFRVADDYRVGAVAWRYDSDREGAFAVRTVLTGEARRERAQARDIIAFDALNVAALTVVADGAARPPMDGDALYLRLEAADTRSTRQNPDPNVSIYPTLIVLNVRQGGEIARELTRAQLRLKDQVRRAEELARLQVMHLQQTKEGIPGEEGALKPVDGELGNIAATQDLITSSLSESSRGYVRVFDGYLFNRLDPSSFTESAIDRLCRLHRQEDGTHYELVARMLADVRREIDDTEVMGKLSRIMDLLMTAADRSSPAISQELKAAFDRRNDSERARALDRSLEAAKRLHADLLALCDKMEEWEDFQDVVQNLQDIIEAQRSLAGRLKSHAGK